MIRPALTIAAVVLWAAPAGAQTYTPSDAAVRGENPQTRKRLAEVEQKLRGGKADGAADELQKLLDDAGDDLVSADGKSFVPARRYVHRFIAQLPAAELKLYQDRVDAPAKALLAAGDPHSLRTLLDRFYCSRVGADALLRHGDSLFERGEFHAAEAAWRQLSNDPFPGDVPHPNRPADPDQILARLGLSAVYRGNHRAASAILEELRSRPTKASGTLVGMTGVYAETLAAVSTAAPKPRWANDGSGTWTTLGGNPARTGRANGPLPPFLAARPTWVTPLPRDTAAESARGEPIKPSPIGSVRSLSFHPVVVGNTVYVADTARILAFDLKTGAVKPGFDGRVVDRVLVPPGLLRIPGRVDADYTLTASSGTLFARFGPPSVLPPVEATRAPSATAAVSVEGLSLKWGQPPPAADGTPAGWEGAAVPAGNLVIAAFSRSDGGRVVHALAAFTADGRRRVWSTDVADAPVGPPGRTRHELVTVAGPVAVFCSHTGVIAAVNAATGKPAWSYRYEKAKNPSPRPRDINPPAAADGRVYVAPTDGENVFAFDAATGRPLWQSPPVKVNQLVGVAAGKVVCTVNGPIAGVRAYSADTGSTDAPEGWTQHDDPALATYGRGLLTDDYFLWPTAAGLFTLKLADGLPARQPNLRAHGNLAFAGGVLLVATPTELWGYVSNPKPEPVADAAWALVPKPPFDLVAVGPAAPTPALQPTMLPAIGLPPKVEPLPAAKPRPAPALPPVALPRPVITSPIVAVADGLVARIGEYHVVKYAPAANRVAWVLDGQSRNRFDPTAGWPSQAFLPHLSADGDRGVAFTAAGRGLLFDNATGAVRNNFEAPHPEHCGPAAFADGVFACPSGPAAVTARGRNDGVVRWRYPAKVAADRPASAAGTAPRIAAHGRDFFVAVNRTFGVELDRVGAADGKPRWPTPVLLPAFEFDPSLLIVTANSIITPLGDRVLALAPDTGRTLWETPLPDDEYTPVPAPNVLLLVGRPSFQRSDDPFAAALCDPNPAYFPGRLRTAYEAWSARSVRVVALDPATGRVKADLELAADGPDVSTATTAAGLVVSAGTRSYRIH